MLSSGFYSPAFQLWIGRNLQTHIKTLFDLTRLYTKIRHLFQRRLQNQIGWFINFPTIMTFDYYKLQNKFVLTTDIFSFVIPLYSKPYPKVKLILIKNKRCFVAGAHVYLNSNDVTYILRLLKPSKFQYERAKRNWGALPKRYGGLENISWQN